MGSTILWQSTLPYFRSDPSCSEGEGDFLHSHNGLNLSSTEVIWRAAELTGTAEFVTQTAKFLHANRHDASVYPCHWPYKWQNVTERTPGPPCLTPCQSLLWVAKWFQSILSTFLSRNSCTAVKLSHIVHEFDVQECKRRMESEMLKNVHRVWVTSRDTARSSK